MHVLIAGNGQPPDRKLFHRVLDTADLLIAADGGALWCLEYGVEPHLVIGDLDSFPTSHYPGITVVHDPDQETNDLEKALKAAMERGARSVTLLGATGRRLDQSLKNISVMAQFAPHFETLLMRDDTGWMCLLPRDYHFITQEGTTVSLFPVSGRVEGIHTEGLAFALHDEPLENGVRDGSSNRATAPLVRIRHRSGQLLLMVLNANVDLTQGS